MLKDLVDYSVSILGIIVFTPFIIIYSALIFLLYRVNPIYRQRRALGNEARNLTVYKLRTLKRNPAIFLKRKGSLKREISDNSYLLLGGFLRKTGLDELPQLLNVLKGQMSIIGPRPLALEDIKLINSEKPEVIIERSKLKSKPGISGLWQLNKSATLDFVELLKYDLEYERNKNIKLDIILFIKTFLKMITVNHLDTIEKSDSNVYKRNLPTIELPHEENILIKG